MMTIMNIPKLLLLGCKVAVIDFLEWCQVVKRFYGRPRYALADLLCLMMYCLNNPYGWCRRTIAKLPANTTQPYGETPITELAKLSELLSLTTADHIIELGCGRGRTAFWLHFFVGCEITAVDIVTVFIRRASRIARWCRCTRLHFIHQEMLLVDFSTATVVYLYGTALDDDYVTKLSQALLQCQPSTRIVTTSYSLNDYLPTELTNVEQPPFVIETTCTAKFSWGTADVYIHRRC